ncbi:hypothetical protein Tco_1136447 [Tanacetum coccineum]
MPRGTTQVVTRGTTNDWLSDSQVLFILGSRNIRGMLSLVDLEFDSLSPGAGQSEAATWHYKSLVRGGRECQVAGTRYCSSEVAVRGGRECQVAVRGGGDWPIRA